MKRLYDLKQAAEYLGLKPYTIRELFWAKKLPAIQLRPKGKLLFDVQDLNQLIDSNKKFA